MRNFGENLQRLMARFGLGTRELSERSGVDERTVRGILNDNVGKPHARTLNKLAEGLGVEVEALFDDPETEWRRKFDRATNPVVEEAAERFPELFIGWSELDFDELFSQFGAGGQLTLEGALETARAMNRKRETMCRLAVVLETGEGPLLSQIIDAFYQRVVLTPSAALTPSANPNPSLSNNTGLPAR